MNKYLKRVFKVKDDYEKDWGLLMKEVEKAEQNEDKKEGAEAFFKILKTSLGRRKRNFVIKKFREYREKK